jgi:hypothetical protein
MISSNDCHRIGILSTFERDLLIKLKVDCFFAKEIIQTHTALSEKAIHWRRENLAAASEGGERSRYQGDTAFIFCIP